jgi:DNA polymerase V
MQQTQHTGCSADGMEPFALRVIGDSMSPEFEDGHIIIVDPGFPLLDGVYAVLEFKGEVFFAQYFCREGRQWLEYLHPDHPPVELDGPYTVKGVVTQRNTRRRKDMKRYDYVSTS